MRKEIERERERERKRTLESFVANLLKMVVIRIENLNQKHTNTTSRKKHGQL